LSHSSHDFMDVSELTVTEPRNLASHDPDLFRMDYKHVPERSREGYSSNVEGEFDLSGCVCQVKTFIVSERGYFR